MGHARPATQEPRFGVPIADDAPMNRFGTRCEQGPRHFAFHPTLRVLYTSNEQGNSVSAYAIGADGALTAAGEPVPTVPADDSTKTHTSEIRVHPSGAMVFCTNRGQDTVACFTVDQETGALTQASRAKTAHTPQALELDPEGAFLYAAGAAPGGESAKTDILTAFQVDVGKGELVKVEEVPLGKSPIRLLAVTVP